MHALTSLSLTQMHRALRDATVSAPDLLEAHIERIQSLDHSINAVVLRDFGRARIQAADSAKRLAQGTGRALEGIPITIKESINVTGLPTSVGNPDDRGFVSAHDAPTVARLRAAGAVILGKSNVPPEMADWQAANPVYGRTNNPWDRARTCGGSSGGGAALSAGFCALDIGSDIGGSVRVPAAFCGVYGLRPSETLVPRSGQYPIPPTPNWGAVLGAQGPLARSAQDIEHVLGVLAGPDVGEDKAWRVSLPAPRCNTLRGARIALLELPEFAPVDPDTLAARQRLIERLRTAGAVVQTAQPQAMEDWRAHYQLYLRLLHYMMSPRWDDSKRQVAIERLRGVDDEFAMAQIEGLRCTGAQLFGWHLQREQYRAAWRAFFCEWDAMLTPAFHTPAFEHKIFDGPALGFGATTHSVQVGNASVPYTRGLFYPHVSTLAGQPAIAFPVGISRAGLPLSMQLIGPYLEDLTVIRLAGLMAEPINMPTLR